MWFNRIWSQDMLHQRTTAWNTQQHVADICLNQVMLVLLWLTDTDFFKNCQISILSSLRKWYLSAKYFYLFILLWLSGRRSDVKKWDCYLFYYRISHRQNYLHKKWSFMLAWQKKMWNNTEQFQSIRSSVTSLTLKGLVFVVFTRHIRWIFCLCLLLTMSLDQHPEHVSLAWHTLTTNSPFD